MTAKQLHIGDTTSQSREERVHKLGLYTRFSLRENFYGINDLGIYFL